MIELTHLDKSDGPLTKRITLGPDGALHSDGSACLMSNGRACRLKLDDLTGFAEHIAGLPASAAIALGALRSDLPDSVEVTTKNKLNGGAGADRIARTADFIQWRQEKPALALLDFDTKGMPHDVTARIDDAGGFWGALVTVFPGIATTGRVTRRSTSAGLSRADTGEALPGSDGQHVFVTVRDGSDVERFLKVLHARCWLGGYGWMIVGAGGQLLERSIVDRMVGGPARLVFEGPPILQPPLQQDQVFRQPVVIEGAALDTIAACPPLTIVEQARLRELHAKEALRLAGDCAAARDTFIARQSKRLAERTGMPAERAAAVIAQQCRGILLAVVALPFDDTELAGATVGDVLAKPARFEGATLADPLEGVEYGAGKAKVMRRADGTPWINSFAHGHTVYELRWDAAAVEVAVNKAPASEAVATFVRLALAAELDASEKERLLDLANQRGGVGKRAIEATLKSERQQQDRQHAQQERERQAGERQDPRPHLTAPAPDAERLPVVTLIDDVLGSQRRPEPPFRDADGRPAEARCRTPFLLHEMLATDLNTGGPDETYSPAGSSDAAADAA